MAYGCLLNRAPNSTKPSERKVSTALALLTFTSIVFRAEVALLLAPLALQALLAGWISLRRLLKTEIVAGLVSMCQSNAYSFYICNSTILL